MYFNVRSECHQTGSRSLHYDFSKPVYNRIGLTSVQIKFLYSYSFNGLYISLKNFPTLVEVRGQFQALTAFSIKKHIPFPIVWLTSEWRCLYRVQLREFSLVCSALQRHICTSMSGVEAGCHVGGYLSFSSAPTSTSKLSSNSLIK